jgi:hypothetical protein
MPAGALDHNGFESQVLHLAKHDMAKQLYSPKVDSQKACMQFFLVVQLQIILGLHDEKS